MRYTTTVLARLSTLPSRALMRRAEAAGTEEHGGSYRAEPTREPLCGRIINKKPSIGAPGFNFEDLHSSTLARLACTRASTVGTTEDFMR